MWRRKQVVKIFPSSHFNYAYVILTYAQMLKVLRNEGSITYLDSKKNPRCVISSKLATLFLSLSSVWHAYMHYLIKLKVSIDWYSYKCISMIIITYLLAY